MSILQHMTMLTRLLVLSGGSSGISLCLFNTVIVTPVGITHAGISLVFLITNGIVKVLLKTMGRKKIIRKTA